MKAKDIFGLIVRVIGLGCIGYGLRYVMSWIYVLARQYSNQSASGTDYLVSAILFLAVGFLLLRKADCVVAFAYPSDREETTKSERRDDVV